MKQSRSVPLFGVLIVGLASGCARPLDLDLLAGTFPLVRYAGQPLPIDRGALPVLCGPPRLPCDPAAPVCHHVLTEGALALDPERRRFALSHLVRESCASRVLSGLRTSGSFERSGGTLRFTADGGRVFEGRIGDGTIEVDHGGEDLIFRLRGHPDKPPVVRGEFRLMEVRDEPLPFDTPTRGRCRQEVRQGVLSLVPGDVRAPDTGRFRLSWEIRDTCSGNVRARSEEGRYEQIGRSLLFTGEPAPGIVHLFQGSLQSDAIVLYIGGESDLVFRRRSGIAARDRLLPPSWLKATVEAVVVYAIRW